MAIALWQESDFLQLRWSTLANPPLLFSPYVGLLLFPPSSLSPFYSFFPFFSFLDYYTSRDVIVAQRRVSSFRVSKRQLFFIDAFISFSLFLLTSFLPFSFFLSFFLFSFLSFFFFLSSSSYNGSLRKTYRSKYIITLVGW